MINEKYSFQSFKRQSFVDVDPAEFNNMEIIGACFYQDEPYTDMFPENVKNVDWTVCNADNCNIPAGVKLNEGTNKHIKIQNDGEYWLVDRDLKPTAPRDPEMFDKCGLSKDPKDIPAEPLEENITLTNDPEEIENRKIEEILEDRPRLIAALKKAGELPKVIE